MQQASVILMQEHDHERCAHIYFKKDIKTTSRVIKDKVILQKFIHHIRKTIEWKTWKIGQSRNKCLLSKTISIFGWKSSTKRGRSTLANGWRWWRAKMVFIDKATRMLEANACIAQTYFPTWPSAHAQHNHVNGSRVKFSVIFKNLWEVNAYALIYASQSLAIHVLMQMGMNLLVAFFTTAWHKW